ncbi:heme ABC exporter ATP-binding protein CcmA [Tsuneonella sp. HG249]
MQPRLTVQDLACRRGDRVLFRGLSFDLRAGDVLHVAGANGVGKSSLLRLLAGLSRTFEGTVGLSGSVGLIDERLAMDEHLPLSAAMRFWERLDGCTDPTMPLSAMELQSLADVPVRFLSTGQRKRLAFARLLDALRDIWLLDEPLNGLDDTARAKVEALVALHCGGGGICVVASHQPMALPGGARRIELRDFAA